MRNDQWLGRGWALLAVLLGSGVFAPSQARIVEDLAVVVDQEILTRGEVEESIQGLLISQGMKPAKPGTPAYEAAKKGVVEGFIQEVLLAEEADRQKVEVSDAEVEHEVTSQIESMKKGFPSEQQFNDELKKEGLTLEDFKQDAREKISRRLKANRVLRMKQQESQGSAQVTDDQARQFFAQHPQDYERIKFSIILFRIQPGTKASNIKEMEKQVQGLLRDLKGGADFSAYAKKYSEDQGSAEKGGLVGTVYRTDLDPILAKGVFAIPEKGLGVVKTPDGIYIVKVDFKTKGDFASVAPGIKEHLAAEKRNSGSRDWLMSLRKNATILVDGKPYVFEAPADTAEDKGAQGQSKTNPTGTSPAPETPAADASGAPSQEPQAEKTIYPSLAPAGGLVLGLAGEGFTYGTKDLSDIHGSGVDTKQNFPYGFGLSAELDYVLDPTFHLGLLLEGLQKVTENVRDSNTGFNYQWGAAVLAPSLALKAVIPMDESTNFILCVSGGYHFLLSGTMSVTDGTNFAQYDLGGSAWGGQAGGLLEFFLDGDRNSALDLGAGYRLLRFSPVTTSVQSASSLLPAPASPMLNSDGSAAGIDFSGVNVTLGLRFYLDKNE